MEPIEPPFVGSYPTFLVGDVVVKLFGEAFNGVASQANEVGMHELLATTDIPAPRILADALPADTLVHFYELVPIFCDTISFEWPKGGDFPKRMMQAVLEFEFDAIDPIRGRTDLARVRTLESLGERLFS